MPSEEATGTAPTNEDAAGPEPPGDEYGFDKFLQIVQARMAEENIKLECVSHDSAIRDLCEEVVANRICIRSTYNSLNELAVASETHSAVTANLGKTLAGVMEVITTNAASLGRAQSGVDKLEKENKALMDGKRRTDALVSDNKALKAEVDTLRNSIDEKIKTAIEKSFPRALKEQVEENTRLVTQIDTDLDKVEEDVRGLKRTVADLGNRAPSQMIQCDLETTKNATEQERRIDALVEENKKLNYELDKLKNSIDEKIKAAIEQTVPANLKNQLKNDKDDIAAIDENLRATDKDLQRLCLKVLHQEAWALGLVETSSDEDDEDDDGDGDGDEDDGDGDEDDGDEDDGGEAKDSEKCDLDGGEGEGESRDGGDDNEDDGGEDSDGGDNSGNSGNSEDGEAGHNGDSSDDNREGDDNEVGGAKGEQEDSGSEIESEAWSLAGQVGVLEDDEACGASHGSSHGVGEYHNGTKRHDFTDRKLDTGDLLPFSSEALVLDKVRRIRQSRSKQHGVARGGASLSSTMASACDLSMGLPKLRSHSTTNLPSCGAPTPPSSATSVTAQIDDPRRQFDGLASELKKEVETAKIAAMKDIAEAARRVDEKADRLDRMMLEFETRMAHAYPATHANPTRQSPIVVDNVAPSTSTSHTGIREIRYDLPRSDKSAKNSDPPVATTASSSQTLSAPKSSPGLFSARKIISYLPGSLSHSKPSTGPTSGGPYMGDTNEKWPSEWPIYWEGGDPTGLGRERKDDGEAGDTGVAERERYHELTESIESLDDYLPLRPKPKPKPSSQ
ncbi:hypothetical protein JCM24511_05148 [Saitozyma sp. JCM 24511]|nr:hypothetical protein JCM24511_05148 [Saitozyma sp. JCM 24511]